MCLLSWIKCSPVYKVVLCVGMVMVALHDWLRECSQHVSTKHNVRYMFENNDSMGGDIACCSDVNQVGQVCLVDGKLTNGCKWHTNVSMSKRKCRIGTQCCENRN